MYSNSGTPRPFHGLLVDLSFYPLLLSSALSCMLLVGRIYLSHSFAYTHLVWNLFLAWVPYGCALWLRVLAGARRPRVWYLIIPGGLWLIFLPNAPYLLTEFVHLQYIVPLTLWYDIGMIAAFAWTGCFLAVVGLQAVQTVVQRYIGLVGGWLFALGVVGLSGLGVYLGRFLRWNSWDLLLDPRAVLSDIVERVAHPRSYPQAVGVSCMFAILLFMCYITFTSSRREATMPADRS